MLTKRFLPKRENARSEAGQSLLEFSLMMIFLVVLLMGVLDLARAYFTYLALKDAAAEGAYFGSVFPQCVDEDGYDLDNNGVDDEGAACLEDHNIPYRVEHSLLRGGLIDWNTSSIKVTPPDRPIESGDVITVAVSTQYTLITPFVSAIVEGQVLTLTASSAATIIRVPDCTDAAGCE